MRGAWICVTVCATTVLRVAPAVLAAWIALHPIPAGCRVECRWVIPPEAFRPGGELYAPPGGLVPRPVVWTPRPVQSIPEPGTAALLVAAGLALVVRSAWR